MRKSEWFGSIKKSREEGLPGQGLLDQIGLMRTYHGRDFLLPVGSRISSRIMEMMERSLPQAPEVVFPDSGAITDLAPMLAAEITSYRQLPAWLKVKGGNNWFENSQFDSAYGPGSRMRWLMASDHENLKPGETWSSALEDTFGLLDLHEVSVLESPHSKDWFCANQDGPDEMLSCTECGWLGRGVFHPSTGEAGEFIAEPVEELREIATPGVTSIDALSGFLDIRPDQTIKTLLLESQNGLVVQVLIQGDRTVSIPKVEEVLGIRGLRTASESALERSGASAGYAGPVMQGNFHPDRVLTDVSVVEGKNYTAGANRPGFHLSGVRMGRDFEPDIRADLAEVSSGELCGLCGGKLISAPGYVFARWFTQDDLFSLTGHGGERFPAGVGIGEIDTVRLMTVLAERGLTDGRMIWPPGIEPFQLYLISIRCDEKAQALYEQLTDEGVSVFYDDRDVRPGVKFNDADLMGCPYRATVSTRSLEQGGIELFTQTSGTREIVQVEQLEALIVGGSRVM